MTSINNLADTIVRELERYANLVHEEVEEAKVEVSNELVDKLKQTSPVLSGSYRKGWRAKKEGNKFIIHNKTDAQLTHLLENGHAKRGGGRVAAIPHIRPAEQVAVADYLERVERAIRT